MTHYFCRLITYSVAFLVLMEINGCQQASYSFQPVPGGYSAPIEAVTTVGMVSVPAANLLPKAQVGTANRIMEVPQRSPRNSNLMPLRIRPFRTRAVVSLARASIRNLPILRFQPKYPAGLQRVPALLAPTRQRSRGMALILAALTGLYGGHRFYLGYRGRGIASIGLALLVLYLFLIGGIAGNSLAGILLLVGLGIWLSVDIIRISINALKPKDGLYYPRLFQIRPATNSPQKDK